MSLQSVDDRRDLFLANTTSEALLFAVEDWIHTAHKAIAERGFFAVALSGGSTPKALYQLLASSPYKEQLDWSNVLLFWSDERAVPPTHPDSNYHMAMESAFSKMPVRNAFRMEAEQEIQRHAQQYDALIRRELGPNLFDLVMLGVGEDGHTASLFPDTEALQVTDALTAANYIPEKKSWRMTLTFPCINHSRRAVVYAFGANKQSIVQKVLTSSLPSRYPASFIGTATRKALWICSAFC